MTEQKMIDAHPAIVYLRSFIKEQPVVGLDIIKKVKALTDLDYLERTLIEKSTSINAWKEKTEIVSGAAMKVSGYLDSIVAAIEATTHGKNCKSDYAHKTVLNVISAISKTESAYREALNMQGASQEVPAFHPLKILPEHFDAVFIGCKKAELRLNDRNFSVGYYLILNEWELNAGYLGRSIVVEVTDVTPCDFAIPNYVMLSFEGIDSMDCYLNGSDEGIPF